MTDRTRQLLVTAGAAFMIFGTLFGFGLIGARVENSSQGIFAADATLIAPAVRAFSIWSVIYLGLIGYLVWQWLPANRTSARARRVGWLSATSMALNGLWLLAAQFNLVWLSVAVILLLAVNLGELVRRLGPVRDRKLAESVLLDGTFGLYLGWVSVASVANITTALKASGFDPGGVAAEAWAAVALALAAALGVVLAARLGGRLSVAAAMAWGLGWIAVGRLGGEPASTVAGIAAVLAAVVVVTAAVLLRRQPAAVAVRAGR